jgi:hypothetical protein
MTPICPEELSGTLSLVNIVSLASVQLQHSESQTETGTEACLMQHE